MSERVRVLVISNRKGGAGKTTVSVNLACEFAASGQRVLLIDLDSQGHCAVGLGVKVNVGESTVHDMFTQPNWLILDCIRQTCVKNVSLLPANTAFQHDRCGHDQQLLLRALSQDAVSEKFDLVIVDTPPSLDNLLLNALCAGTWVLVPYVPHPLSFEGVRQLVRVLFKIISEQNPTLKILGFLPMMVAGNVRQHRDINSQMTRQFGTLRVLGGIRSDIKLAEAFGSAKPVRDYAPKSRGAEDFATLANLLTTLMEK
ncbi:MAG: ParA family protein [Methylococcales bacterium]|jgi:chromosome partitioning protein|nr:ParA family protein [Methylococcales bacterium]